MNGTLDIEGAAQLIAWIDPDIIALQEVDEFRPRSHFVRQAAFLARYLDMNYVFGASSRYPTGAYGNALLSKFPVISSSSRFLPSSHERRALLEVRIAVDNQVVTLVNLHLGLNSPERCRQLQKIILPIMKSYSHAAVLLGDFNSPDDSAEMQMVAGSLHDTFASNSGLLHYTYTSDNPQVRIDYIFINQHCTCPDFYIVDSKASDHLPAVAHITI